MNPFSIWRGLGLAGRLTVVLIAMAVIAYALWWALGGARRDAKQAQVDGAMSAAHGKSATEATNIIADGAVRDAATDTITRENANAIDHAKGADQAVHPDANAAGLGGLCQRPDYRGTKQCVQLLGPEELPVSRPRR
jgi:hypothetical protein